MLRVRIFLTSACRMAASSGFFRCSARQRTTGVKRRPRRRPQRPGRISLYVAAAEYPRHTLLFTRREFASRTYKSFAVPKFEIEGQGGCNRRRGILQILCSQRTKAPLVQCKLHRFLKGRIGRLENIHSANCAACVGGDLYYHMALQLSVDCRLWICGVRLDFGNSQGSFLGDRHLGSNC
jgi:hypothetical protein